MKRFCLKKYEEKASFLKVTFLEIQLKPIFGGFEIFYFPDSCANSKGFEIIPNMVLFRDTWLYSYM